MQTNPVPNEERPIFIFGCQRSGTTLLRLMFTSHPAICIPPESNFLFTLAERYGAIPDLTNQLGSFLDDLYRDPKFPEWGVERAALEAKLRERQPVSFRTAVAVIHLAYRDRMQPGAEFWGNKNPDFVFHVPVILNQFPQARMVHIVRDVRGVYASLSSKEIRESKAWKGMKSPLLLASRNWSQAAKVYREYKNDGRFYTLYYEKLVANPEEELKALMKWTGIDYAPQMLRFYEENQKKTLVPKHRLQWHSRTLGPVSEDAADAWKEKLSGADIEAIEHLTAQDMECLGYPLQTRSPRFRGAMKSFVERMRAKG